MSQCIGSHHFSTSALSFYQLSLSENFSSSTQYPSQNQQKIKINLPHQMSWRNTSSEKHLACLCKSLTANYDIIFNVKGHSGHASQHIVAFLAFLFSAWIILCCDLLNCFNCLEELMFQISGYYDKLHQHFPSMNLLIRYSQFGIIL